MKKIDAAKVASLSKEEKLKLYDLIQTKKKAALNSRDQFVPHAGQLPVLLSDKYIRLVTAGNGCWAPGTLVRMYDGSLKKVEEVKIGDELLGPDSLPRKVLALASGNEEMYEITPKWGKPYTVNATHILSIYRWRKARAGEIEGKAPGEAVIKYEEIMLRDWLNLGKEAQRISYQWKPPEGVSFLGEMGEAELPIDPYILGLWLGDGHSNTLALTTMDEEICTYWCNHFSKYNMRVENQEGNKASTYFVTNEARPFPERTAFKELELFNNKHIPRIYMRATKEVRLKLLAGLIDTDGYYPKDGKSFEIAQVRLGLAEQIKELAESLGFYVQTGVKVVKGVSYYRQHIYGDLERIPTKLPRKQIQLERIQQRKNKYEPFTVSAKGIGEYYGFELSGDGLLLLEDYTVNHNSGKTCLGVNQVLAAVKGYNPWREDYTKVPCTGVVVLDNPLKVSEVWLKEMNKWYDMSKVEVKKNGKPYVNELLFENGSRVIFMFWDQEEMVFESLELDWAVFDEPPPRHIFIALSRGQRTKGSRPWQLIIGTPLAAAWLRQEIYEPWEKGERPDVECFRGTTEQNKQNLADGYMEQFGRLLSEEEKKIRFEGQWFDLGGLALKHLIKPEVHYIPRFKIEPHWPVVIAIDPHPVKAHVAVAITKDPKSPAGSAIAIGELKAKATARDFAAQLHAFKRGWKVVDIVCDSLGATDGTGGEGFKSFIEVLNTCGITTRATTYEEKLDEDWIERIKNALDIPEQPDNLGRREPKLKIFDDLVGLKKDIENVAWIKYRNIDEYKPKLDISNKDVLACLKYALAASNNLDRGAPGSMQSQVRDLNGSVVRSNSSKSRGSFLRRMYKG